MWKKVNATRDPADAVVSAAAVKTAAAEESAGPKQLDVAAAPPPLWASVHLGKKDEASKMWQTVRAFADRRRAHHHSHRCWCSSRGKFHVPHRADAYARTAGDQQPRGRPAVALRQARRGGGPRRGEAARDRRRRAGAGVAARAQRQGHRRDPGGGRDAGEAWCCVDVKRGERGRSRRVSRSVSFPFPAGEEVRAAAAAAAPAAAPKAAPPRCVKTTFTAPRGRMRCNAPSGMPGDNPPSVALADDGGLLICVSQGSRHHRCREARQRRAQHHLRRCVRLHRRHGCARAQGRAEGGRGGGAEAGQGGRLGPQVSGAGRAPRLRKKLFGRVSSCNVHWGRRPLSVTICVRRIGCGGVQKTTTSPFSLQPPSAPGGRAARGET